MVSPTKKKCTEPVTSSSGNPTDLRRSGCHSESHQPRTLRTRCSRDSMRTARAGSSRRRRTSRNLRQRGLPGAWRCKGDDSAKIGPIAEPSRGDGFNKKCTEPVSPSSGNPTDLRRSDCHSESHQPRALRTRCKQHTMGIVQSRQGPLGRACRNLRSFLFTQVKLRMRVHALVAPKKEKGRARGPGRKNSPSRERFRPPSRQTVRFRVVLLGGLRPTGAPCSAQRHSMQIQPRRSRAVRTEFDRNCGLPRRCSPMLAPAPPPS
jgi:hypothetical protein